MFAAPGSTPPGTPGRGHDDDGPSTTPAGPPPSHRTSASFTPAGQPPSSIFNSSIIPPSSTTGGSRLFNFGDQPSTRTPNLFAPKSTPGTGGSNLFGPKPTPGESRPLFGEITKPSFGVPPMSSPPLPQASEPSDDEHDDEYAEDDTAAMMEDAQGEEEEEEVEEVEEEVDAMDEDEDMMEEEMDGESEEDTGFGGPSNNPFDLLRQSMVSQQTQSPQKSSLPPNFGLSTLSQTQRDAEGYQQSPPKEAPFNFGLSTLSQIQQQAETYSDGDNIGGLAKNYSASRPAAGLVDSPQLVIDINEHMEAIQVAMSKEDVSQRNYAVFKAVEHVWQGCARSSSPPEEYTGENIGPGEEDTNLTKFNFVFSLLSQIYQPSTEEVSQKMSSSRFSRSAFSHSTTQIKKSIPKVLLDWLNNHHDTNPTQPLRNNQDGFSANPNFWEIVRSVLLRGDFRSALALLRGANFDIAYSALHDGEQRPGYKGGRLTAVTKAVGRLIQVLQACPAAQDDHDNWETWTFDWLEFKGAAKSALDDLQTTAEGQSRDRDVPLPQRKSKRAPRKFGNSSFSGSLAGESEEQNDDFSFSQASRKAESAVPWSVYESLQLVYKQLIGDPDALLQASLDWVEASIALTVWWDIPLEIVSELGQTSNAILPSRETPLALPSPPAEEDAGERDSIVDHDPQVEVFRQKLQDSFIAATTAPDDESGMFRPDPSSGIEISLACAMALDLEGVALIVRGWSATLFTAFVEIANQAGWIERQHDVRDELDETDLMVLGYSAQGQSLAKPKSAADMDAALEKYAGLLESVDVFKSSDMDASRNREGWELAARTLGRMQNEEQMKKKMKELMGRIDLQDGGRVDLLLELCEDMGLSDQARDVSEVSLRFLAILPLISLTCGSAICHCSSSTPIQTVGSGSPLPCSQSQLSAPG
jgi:hypothetical protein